MKPFIQTGHIKQSGVYPILLDTNKNGYSGSFLQKALDSNQEPLVAKVLKLSSDILLSDNLCFLEERVKDNMLEYMTIGWRARLTPEELGLTGNCIHDLIRTIPVYLVKKGYDKIPSTTTTSDGINKLYKIPSDKIPVRFYDDWNDLDKDLEEGCLGERISGRMGKCVDALGMYVSDKKDKNRFEYLTKLHHDLNDIKHSNRIFLWVDNIENTAKEFGLSFENLFCFTLCHEFMHALMDVYDVYNDRFRITDASNAELEAYKVIREESLANGLAIYLFNLHASKNDKKLITDFAKQQPLPYQLGLLYDDMGNNAQSEVINWMDIKSGKSSLTRDEMYESLKNLVNEAKRKGLL